MPMKYALDRLLPAWLLPAWGAWSRARSLLAIKISSQGGGAFETALRGPRKAIPPTLRRFSGLVAQGAEMRFAAPNAGGSARFACKLVKISDG